MIGMAWLLEQSLGQCIYLSITVDDCLPIVVSFYIISLLSYTIIQTKRHCLVLAMNIALDIFRC